MMIAKIGDKIVEVIRIAETVAFSTEQNWVCICDSSGKYSEQKRIITTRWVPATTRFEWVRTFNFYNEITE